MSSTDQNAGTVSSVSSARCIVVGASGVLGRTIVAELARRGARVVGTFHTNEAAAAEIARAVPGFVAKRLDLNRAGDIDRVLGELANELGGEVDTLIHCPTVASAMPASSLPSADKPAFDRLEEIDPEALAHMMSVNVASPLFCARAVAALDAKNASDRPRPRPRNIIFVGSIDGVKPVPTSVPYAATKGALVALARALAKELGPRNILVNVVAPGLLESGASRIVPEETKREYLKHSALKRFGKPEEIARSIAWLALSNTYITGQTLVIDGGL